MRERAEQLLKIAGLVLGTLVLFQVVRAVFFGNPLARVRIPDVPTLPGDTNAPAAVKGTNAGKSVTLASGSNMASSKSIKTGTNVAAGPVVSTGTNSTPAAVPQSPASNAVVQVESTNLPSVAAPTPPAGSPTNLAVAAGVTNPGITSTSVTMILPAGGTNVVSGARLPAMGTNVAALLNRTNSTNAVLMSSMGAGPNPALRAAMSGMAGLGGMRLPDLPPEAKARVYRVVDSELLGQVIRPQPMALLGVAGNMAFLRAANGQTGTAKEGESVGDLKLLRIGINRVLVEQDGQEKELTIFSGYGSESLLSKPKERSDETTSK